MISHLPLLSLQTLHPFPPETKTILLKSRVSSDVLVDSVHVDFKKAKESGVEMIGLSLTKILCRVGMISQLINQLLLRTICRINLH